MADDSIRGFTTEAEEAGETSSGGTDAANSETGRAWVEVEKPAAGETQVISTQVGEIYVLEFLADEAHAYVEGGDLILAFDDGSRIVFEGLVNLVQLDQERD